MKKRDLVITWHSRNRSRPPRPSSIFFANLRHLAGDDARSVDVLLTRSHAWWRRSSARRTTTPTSRDALVASRRFLAEPPSSRARGSPDVHPPTRHVVSLEPLRATLPLASNFNARTAMLALRAPVVTATPGLRPAASVRGTVAAPSARPAARAAPCARVSRRVARHPPSSPPRTRASPRSRHAAPRDSSPPPPATPTAPPPPPPPPPTRLPRTTSTPSPRASRPSRRSPVTCSPRRRVWSAPPPTTTRPRHGHPQGSRPEPRRRCRQGCRTGCRPGCRPRAGRPRQGGQLPRHHGDCGVGHRRRRRVRGWRDVAPRVRAHPRALRLHRRVRRHQNHRRHHAHRRGATGARAGEGGGGGGERAQAQAQAQAQEDDLARTRARGGGDDGGGEARDAQGGEQTRGSRRGDGGEG